MSGGDEGPGGPDIEYEVGGFDEEETFEATVIFGLATVRFVDGTGPLASGAHMLELLSESEGIAVWNMS